VDRDKEREKEEKEVKNKKIRRDQKGNRAKGMIKIESGPGP